MALKITSTGGISGRITPSKAFEGFSIATPKDEQRAKLISPTSPIKTGGIVSSAQQNVLKTQPTPQTSVQPTAAQPIVTQPVAPVRNTVTLPNGKVVDIDQTGNIIGQDFQVDTSKIATVPAPVVARVATTAPTTSDLITPILSQQEELQRLQAEILAKASPTAEELETVQQIRNLNLEQEKQTAISEARLAPTFAIRGEQAEIARMGAIQRNALANTLSALTDNRTGQLEALQTAAGFTTENINNLLTIGKFIQDSLAQEPADFTSARQGAILNIIGQGVTDPAQVFDLINFDEQGNQVGDITIEEIEKVMKFVGGAGGTLTPDQISNSFKLAADYESVSKDFFKQRDAYNRVVASAKDPSAAGDLALIFNYMKVLDPGSTVREGEFANAENSGSIDQRIIAQYNKVRDGERLAPEQRADFLDRAGRLFNEALTQQQSVNQEYVDRADRIGVPSDLVVRDLIATSTVGDGGFTERDTEIIRQIQQENPGVPDEELYQIYLDTIQGNFNQVESDTNQALNRPQRNNNPGNVKRGGLADDLAVGTDEQGHLIFPDAQTGFQALALDLNAKISGNSRFLPPNPTIAQLGKVYAEDPNWPVSVSKMLGVDPNTRTANLDFSELLQAIARQEGFFA